MRLRFDLSKHPELAISSFELALLTGHDERAALERAGEDASGFDIGEQLIAEAIKKVDDQQVVTPYIAWSAWDSRTRSAVRHAFRSMSVPDKAQMDAFLATEADGAFDAMGLDLAFETIELRSLSGREEGAAIRALGADPSGPAIEEAVIGASISAVDGEAVGQSFSWTDWDVRTRAFVREAHGRMATLGDEALADIVGGARPPAEAGPTEPG